MLDWIREQARLRRLWTRILAAAIGIGAGLLAWRIVAALGLALGWPDDLRDGLCLFAALVDGWGCWVMADLMLQGD